MANSSISSLVFSLLILTLTLTTFLPSTHAAFARAVSKEELGLKASSSSDNLTQLTFYLHDVVSGPSPTVAQIAQAKGSNSTSAFGSLLMLDDLLTDGPDSTSKLVGRAQGMYALADQSENAPIMIMNLLFLEEQYNGSTLSVLGRNPVNQGVRELPVLGGTGVFRFAKGYAQAKTHTFDKTTGNSVVEYNVFVSHASGSDGGSGSAPGSGSGGGGFGSGSGSGSPGSTPSNGANSLGLGFLTSMVSLCLFPILYLAC